MNRGTLSAFKPESLYAFTSALLTIPAAATPLAVAHGLGVTPVNLRANLLCVALDAATLYTPGDLIPYGPQINDGTNSAFLTADGGNLRWTLGGSVVLGRKTDGVRTAVTSTANFRLILYAQ